MFSLVISIIIANHLELLAEAMDLLMSRWEDGHSIDCAKLKQGHSCMKLDINWGSITEALMG